MRWSRYNLLFESARNGWLLYNSASNAFLKLEEDSLELIQKMKDDTENFPYEQHPMMYFSLRSGGFLVEDTQDDDFVRIKKMLRTAQNYKGRTLALTIAPTRDCNFACPYCYEANRTESLMSEETEDKIVTFVEKHTDIKKLAVTWYGGEPLLYFDKIKSLHDKFEKLGKEYTGGIITNGYLLDDKVISHLEEMHIKRVQITLDGKRETHDSRRYLIGGGKTYDVILSNIDNLMKSDWTGKLHIRVNVDPSNKQEYVDVHKMIEARYPDEFQKRVIVYPGFISSEDANPDISCFFDSGEKGKFLADLAAEYGINALDTYPRAQNGGCTMTMRNAYVIGPDGEMYKCWDDVGRPELVVGNVESFSGWNMALIAEGMIEGSYVEDETCNKCFYFPICDGGCSKMRMLNKRDGGNRDNCSYFKKHIKEMLELHYEQKQEQQK